MWKWSASQQWKDNSMPGYSSKVSDFSLARSGTPLDDSVFTMSDDPRGCRILIQYPSGTSFSFSAIVQSSFSILRVILRTGDLSKFLYHMMQHLRQFGICGFIIHFLSIPAADDQAAAL